MPVCRLLYFSENLLGNGRGHAFSQLADIMAASKRRNRPAGLTGALVVDPLWFIQILEGDRAAVWQTFKRLEDDERHANVVLAEMRDCETRVFANWWMGLVRLDDANRALLGKHLVEGRVQPDRMSAAQILALMSDVATLGLTRETAAA